VTATNSVSSQTATTSVTVDETIAGLSADNDSPTVLGNTTTLTATISAGSNVTYEWDFGDGSSNEFGRIVTHVYPSNGNYTATVTATNSVTSDSATTSVVIGTAITDLSAENDGPTVLGNTTTLTATINAGSDVTYEWDFGDGSSTETGKIVTHVYSAPGTYIATVTATNNVGSDSATTSVYVDTVITGLTAVNDSPTTLYEITTLSAWIVDGSNVTYTWDFGDGSSTETGQVLPHVYPVAGTYIATVTATNSVSTVSATTEVTVENLKIYLPILLYK